MDRDYTKEQGSLTEQRSQGTTSLIAPLNVEQEGEGFFQKSFFRERGLQVLRKSRTRQLTYGSGAEPQHRGLGQHLYNSQSSIGSRQNGDELRLVQTFDQRLIATRPECPSILRPYSHSEERPSGRGLAASWPRPPAYRHEILDLNSQIGNCIPVSDIRIGTWVHGMSSRPRRKTGSSRWNFC